MDFRNLQADPQLRIQFALARFSLARLALQLLAKLRRSEDPRRVTAVREPQCMDHQFLEARVQRLVDLCAAIEDP